MDNGSEMFKLQVNYNNNGWVDVTEEETIVGEAKELLIYKTEFSMSSDILCICPSLFFLGVFLLALGDWLLDKWRKSQGV